MSLDQSSPQLRPLVLLVALFVALALQTTVLAGLSVRGVKPDLVLVIALCCGLLAGPGVGAVWGATAGLIEGFAQGMHVGSLGMSRTVGAFLAGRVETHILRDKVVVPAGTVLLCSLAAHAVYFVMSPEFPVARPLHIALVESLLNMALTPPIYLALLRWGLAYRR